MRSSRHAKVIRSRISKDSDQSSYWTQDDEETCYSSDESESRHHDDDDDDSTENDGHEYYDDDDEDDDETCSIVSATDHTRDDVSASYHSREEEVEDEEDDGISHTQRLQSFGGDEEDDEDDEVDNISTENKLKDIGIVVRASDLSNYSIDTSKSVESAEEEEFQAFVKEHERVKKEVESAGGGSKSSGGSVGLLWMFGLAGIANEEDEDDIVVSLPSILAEDDDDDDDDENENEEEESTHSVELEGNDSVLEDDTHGPSTVENSARLAVASNETMDRTKYKSGCFVNFMSADSETITGSYGGLRDGEVLIAENSTVSSHGSVSLQGSETYDDEDNGVSYTETNTLTAADTATYADAESDTETATFDDETATYEDTATYAETASYTEGDTLVDVTEPMEESTANKPSYSFWMCCGQSDVHSAVESFRGAQFDDVVGADITPVQHNQDKKNTTPTSVTEDVPTTILNTNGKNYRKTSSAKDNNVQKSEQSSYVPTFGPRIDCDDDEPSCDSTINTDNREFEPTLRNSQGKLLEQKLSNKMPPLHLAQVSTSIAEKGLQPTPVAVKNNDLVESVPPIGDNEGCAGVKQEVFAALQSSASSDDSKSYSDYRSYSDTEGDTSVNPNPNLGNLIATSSSSVSGTHDDATDGTNRSISVATHRLIRAEAVDASEMMELTLAATQSAERKIESKEKEAFGKGFDEEDPFDEESHVRYTQDGVSFMFCVRQEYVQHSQGISSSDMRECSTEKLRQNLSEEQKLFEVEDTNAGNNEVAAAGDGDADSGTDESTPKKKKAELLEDYDISEIVHGRRIFKPKSKMGAKVVAKRGSALGEDARTKVPNPRPRPSHPFSATIGSRRARRLNALKAHREFLYGQPERMESEQFQSIQQGAAVIHSEGARSRQSRTSPGDPNRDDDLPHTSMAQNVDFQAKSDQNEANSEVCRASAFARDLEKLQLMETPTSNSVVEDGQDLPFDPQDDDALADLVRNALKGTMFSRDDSANRAAPQEKGMLAPTQNTTDIDNVIPDMWRAAYSFLGMTSQDANGSTGIPQDNDALRCTHFDPNPTRHWNTVIQTKSSKPDQSIDDSSNSQPGVIPLVPQSSTNEDGVLSGEANQTENDRSRADENAERSSPDVTSNSDAAVLDHSRSKRDSEQNEPEKDASRFNVDGIPLELKPTKIWKAFDSFSLATSVAEEGGYSVASVDVAADSPTIDGPKIDQQSLEPPSRTEDKLDSLTEASSPPPTSKDRPQNRLQQQPPKPIYVKPHTEKLRPLDVHKNSSRNSLSNFDQGASTRTKKQRKDSRAAPPPTCEDDDTSDDDRKWLEERQTSQQSSPLPKTDLPPPSISDVHQLRVLDVRARLNQRRTARVFKTTTTTAAAATITSEGTTTAVVVVTAPAAVTKTGDGSSRRRRRQTTVRDDSSASADDEFFDALTFEDDGPEEEEEDDDDDEKQQQQAQEPPPSSVQTTAQKHLRPKKPHQSGQPISPATNDHLLGVDRQTHQHPGMNKGVQYDMRDEVETEGSRGTNPFSVVSPVGSNLSADFSLD